MHLIALDHARRVASLLAALVVQPARAAGVEDFYKGKTVSIVIGYSVGGGYDAYGRLVARHLGKYIPGQPNVVPQNMTGAGSLKAANYIYSVAPKDGLGDRHVLAQPGDRAAAQQGGIRQHQVHLARQRHRRGQSLRHPAASRP